MEVRRVRASELIYRKVTEPREAIRQRLLVGDIGSRINDGFPDTADLTDAAPDGFAHIVLVRAD